MRGGRCCWEFGCSTEWRLERRRVLELIVALCFLFCFGLYRMNIERALRNNEQQRIKADEARSTLTRVEMNDYGAAPRYLPR
jgi:hypothetical protein